MRSNSWSSCGISSNSSASVGALAFSKRQRRSYSSTASQGGVDHGAEFVLGVLEGAVSHERLRLDGWPDCIFGQDRLQPVGPLTGGWTWDACPGGLHDLVHPVSQPGRFSAARRPHHPELVGSYLGFLHPGSTSSTPGRSRPSMSWVSVCPESPSLQNRRSASCCSLWLSQSFLRPCGLFNPLWRILRLSLRGVHGRLCRFPRGLAVPGVFSPI